MDSNIAIAAATSFAVALAAKGVEGPAKTLDLLWKSTFGRWDPLLENYIAENARKYATSIENKISHIPPEYINQKPDISVLGPALEASKYYVAETEIREMFANLIAADFDMRKKDQVHHAFVDIIRQMTSNDAKLFKLLPSNGPLVELRGYHQDGKFYDRLALPKDLIYIPNIIENHLRENAVSINNMARLGLVEIDHVMSLIDNRAYENYKQLEEYKECEEIIASDPQKYKELVMSKGMFSITPLGEIFKKICLSNYAPIIGKVTIKKK